MFAGGNPTTGPALFSQQLSIIPTDLDEPRLFTWDLTTADLFFEVGEVFTFGLTAEQAGYIIAGNDPPGYPGGELFRNGSALPISETNDMAFITYVPEPAPLLLVALALVAALSFRRRGVAC